MIEVVGDDKTATVPFCDLRSRISRRNYASLCMHERPTRALLVCKREFCGGHATWNVIIHCCIRGIFLFERKSVPWYSRPVAIISTQNKVNGIAADMEEVDVHSIIDSIPPI